MEMGVNGKSTLEACQEFKDAVIDLKHAIYDTLKIKDYDLADKAFTSTFNKLFAFMAICVGLHVAAIMVLWLIN